MRTRTILTIAATAALALPAVTAAAAPGGFPGVIDLPDGFQPEGIAISGNTAYAGSLADGDVVEVDLRTGAVEEFYDAPEGAGPTVGLAVAGRTLYAANGPAGTVTSIDTRTGERTSVVVAGDGFVNDVVVGSGSVWATNSFASELYRIDIERRGTLGQVETITVSGDFEAQPGFNLNGIALAGDTPVVVQSGTGLLFAVAPDTGDATQIALTDEAGPTTVVAGDGILLRGTQLLVVQNQLNTVTTIELSGDLSSGMIVDRSTQDTFDVPTTVATFGGRQYVVNARFGTPPTPDTGYTLVRVDG